MFEFIKSLFGRGNKDNTAVVTETISETDKIALAKKEYRERKAKVDAIIKGFDDADYEARRKFIAKENERVKKSNSVCPHCGGTNVHQEIKRIKGSVNGKLDAYSNGGGALFSHYHDSSVKGSIKGELDTFQINKCNDCGQEWNIEKEKSPYDVSWYSGKVDYTVSLNSFFYNIEQVLEVEYDPKDITEEFDSYEEKRESQIKHVKICYKEFLELPLEILWYYFDKYSYKLYSDTYGKLSKSNRYDNDPYIVNFKKEVIKVLEELGVKKISDNDQTL